MTNLNADVQARHSRQTSTSLFHRLLCLALFCLGAVELTAKPLDKAASNDVDIIKSHAIAMHGQPKYAANFDHFEYTSPAAKKGGELRLHSLGSFDSLNTFIAKGNSADNLGLIYDSLTVNSLDEPFTQYGLIAQTIEYPSDRSWVIFHLHPDARFHDGRPITAEDVVFTFNLLIEQGSPTYKFNYAGVDTVTALDKARVKFSFKSKQNRELALTVGQLPVLPKHYWQKHDFGKSSLEQPLGSGPYRIHKVDPGRRIVYQRDDNYWAKDLSVNRGLYNFDQISTDYYRDANVALEALKAGEYDYRRENSSKFWATAYDTPAVHNKRLIKEDVPHQATSGMQGFSFNMRKPLFKDRRVRQAIGYAFDFEWSNQSLFYQAYTRCDSFFSNGELASRGLPQGEELALLNKYKDQLPADIFTQVFTPPSTDGSGRNRKNLRQAKRLLDQAGYKVVDNQLMTPEGEEFEFEILLVSQQFERIVNPFAKSLERLGIKVKVRLVDVSQYINRMRSFDYDMMVQVIPQSLSPGNEQIEFWGSHAADTEGSRNVIGVKHPVIDALTQKIAEATDRQQLVTATRALDRVLLNQYYVVPQWYKASNRLVYWNKFSKPAIAPKYDSYYSTAIHTWWHDPEKQQQHQNYHQALQ